MEECCVRRRDVLRRHKAHLEALLAAQVAAVLEHVARLGVQRPVAALPGPLGAPRHLQEAVVERERVPAKVQEAHSYT